MTDSVHPHSPERTTPVGDGIFAVHPGEQPGMTYRQHLVAQVLPEVVRGCIADTTYHTPEVVANLTVDIVDAVLAKLAQ